MSKGLTPVDVYALMNSVVAQATGRTDLTATDTTSFVSVGQTVLSTGTENTLNALSTVLADTIFSVRPYKGKLQSLVTTQRRWGAQVRKVVYLYSEAEASQDWNTTTNAHQLDDASSVDMYKIRKPKVLQLNFYGSNVLQKHITRFRDQLSLAFSSEDEFIRFIDGVMVEFGNEIELLNEAKTRATLLNFIGAVHGYGDASSKVDLVALYNSTYNETYTREDLLAPALIESFAKFVAATIKTYSSRLTDMTTNYHVNITGKSAIMRHTPKEKQKMIMYAPFFTQMEANVYSSIFNPEYLNIGEFEEVNFWQSQSNPSAINVTPTYLNAATGAQADGTAQSIPYMLGILFDADAVGVMPQFEYASTTPFNSAGGYFNMFLHWRFNSYNDQSENSVIFVLGNGGE